MKKILIIICIITVAGVAINYLGRSKPVPPSPFKKVNQAEYIKWERVCHRLPQKIKTKGIKANNFEFGEL